MKKKLPLTFLCVLLYVFCSAQKPAADVNINEVKRIVTTLSSDDMEGRLIFTPGIEKAAKFIENEFRSIGLKPMDGLTGFRQDFQMTRVQPGQLSAEVNGIAVEPDNVFALTDKAAINFKSDTFADREFIKAGESFTSRYKAIVALNKPVVVFVDRQFADAFARLRAYNMRDRLISQPNEKTAAVFILGAEDPVSFSVNFTNRIQKSPLFNIAGVLPGKSKATEMVIFSGHYDHLGIIDAVEGDSIANGADDDASGITAVISLARYYKKLGNNERTLLFAAFTAEEAGMIGSEYFATAINPARVSAMVNIEMIGKESKFGKNAAFITGYERSDFGKILQKNVSGTAFKFYPDPYPDIQLFYRSDNASLASLGVPAHTVSTDKIDQDAYYHTVKDEVSTLDVENISATIKAIIAGVSGIVAGTETPTRVPALKR